jgi:hypothetical protein
VTFFVVVGTGVLNSHTLAWGQTQKSDPSISMSQVSGIAGVQHCACLQTVAFELDEKAETSEKLQKKLKVDLQSFWSRNLV